MGDEGESQIGEGRMTNNRFVVSVLLYKLVKGWEITLKGKVRIKKRLTTLKHKTFRFSVRSVTSLQERNRPFY